MAADALDQFIMALTMDDADGIQAAIAAGADVNAIVDPRTQFGAIHMAACGYENALRVLLASRGIKVNATAKNGETALMLAVSTGMPKLVEMLLAAGADLKVTTTKQTEWLFGGRPSRLPAGITVIDVAAAAKATDMQQLLQRSWGTGFEQLETKAAETVHHTTRDRPHASQAFGAGLSGGASGGASGGSPPPLAVPPPAAPVTTATTTTLIRATTLHEAATKGDLDALRFFIANGADVNEPDAAGITPIIAAIRGGQAQAVRILTNCRKLDLKQQSDNVLPLECAIDWDLSGSSGGLMTMYVLAAMPPRDVDPAAGAAACAALEQVIAKLQSGVLAGLSLVESMYRFNGDTAEMSEGVQRLHISLWQLVHTAMEHQQALRDRAAFGGIVGPAGTAAAGDADIDGHTHGGLSESLQPARIMDMATRREEMRAKFIQLSSASLDWPEHLSTLQHVFSLEDSVPEAKSADGEQLLGLRQQWAEQKHALSHAASSMEDMHLHAATFASVYDACTELATKTAAACKLWAAVVGCQIVDQIATHERASSMSTYLAFAQNQIHALLPALNSIFKNEDRAEETELRLKQQWRKYGSMPEIRVQLDTLDQQMEPVRNQRSAMVDLREALFGVFEIGDNEQFGEATYELFVHNGRHEVPPQLVACPMLSRRSLQWDCKVLEQYVTVGARQPKVSKVAVRSLNTGAHFKALKAMSLGSDGLDQLEAELTHHARLSHPCVLPLEAVFEEDGVVYLQSPWCAGGNLQEWVQGQSCDLRAVIQCCMYVLQAIAYIHDMGILHGSIKATHVVIVPIRSAVDGPIHGQPFLFNFTSAKGNKGVQYCKHSNASTPADMEPAIITKRRAFGADILAFGQMLEKLAATVTASQPASNARLAALTQELVAHCTHADPVARWSAREALTHEVFQSFPYYRTDVLQMSIRGVMSVSRSADGIMLMERWEWRAPTATSEWELVPPALTLQFEAGYAQATAEAGSLTFCALDTESSEETTTMWIVSLNEMLARLTNTSKPVTKLIRRNMTMFMSPITWYPQSSNAVCIPLHPSSEEFSSVARQLLESLPATILSIDRVQAHFLFQRYRYQQLFLASRDQRAGNEVMPEQLLWYGSKSASVRSIWSSSKGFSRSLTGKQGIFGRAVYFAERASYLHPPARGVESSYFPVAGDPTACELILARVATGVTMDYGTSVTDDMRSMSQPPPRTDSACPYDSVTGGPHAPPNTPARHVAACSSRLYGIYQAAYAYPAYVVRYRL